MERYHPSRVRHLLSTVRRGNDGLFLTDVRVLENSAVSYHHGAGPIAVKMLIDEGVKVVLANELGLGASELLKQHNLEVIQVKPGTNVENATKKVMHTHK